MGNVKQADNGRVKLTYNNADTNYESDPFNRITKVTQVLPGGVKYSTEYQYDKMGQMTGILYPNSREWLTYEYDLMGRVVAVPGFAGTKASPGLAYDENSALRMVRTDNGITMEIPELGGRDKNGRLREMLYTGANGNEVLRLTYDYDKANNIVRRNDNTYVYDELNRLQRATIYGAFEDSFTKDDMNIGQADQDYHGEKEPEEDVTDQTEIKLDYSARSLIFNLRTEAENVSRIELVPVQARHRLPVEQIEIYYKQRETDFFYTKLERSAWTGSKDEQGRIIIKFNPVLKASMLKVHCNYDDLDLWQLPVDRAEFFNTPEQLATVYQKLVTRTESYAYDAMGNRTTERILLRKEYGYTYTYYPNSNRLKSKEKADGTERVDYEYDPNGNLTVKVVTKEETVIRWEYSYDLLNQLEEVKKNGEVVSTYTYDPNGFRVEKVGSKGKIHYVPLLNGEVGYRKEFSSNSEYSFIYVGGQHFARVDGVIGGEGKKYFYHNDHLGSALAVTDEQGNKVVERDFTPFGERINVDIYDETNRDPAEDDSGFTGKDWDADVELYYFNARWYDAGIGRFISQDPVEDDPTLYVYGFNNPMMFVDPSGYWNVSVNWSNVLSTSITYISPETGELIGTFSVFRVFVGTYHNIKWNKFLESYAGMNEEAFKAYLEEKGINYQFNENNTTNYVFTNTEGQQALKRSSFASTIVQKALIGDEKLSYFHAMEGNIKAFLENNPGLSLEQVKGIFDSAVISAHNDWGFGKNEFRYEGRGSNYAGLYNAEAIVMNEGMILGVFTRASTLPDNPKEHATVLPGVYDYVVGRHHQGRVHTDIGQPVPVKEDGSYYTYKKGDQEIEIKNWQQGAYKALRLQGRLPAMYGTRKDLASYINSHVGCYGKRGAEGCMTLHPDDYLSYMNLFNWGDRGKFVIIR